MVNNPNQPIPAIVDRSPAAIVDDCPDTLEEAIHRARYMHSEPWPMDSSDQRYAERIAAEVREWQARQPVAPIPMVLHCPSCGSQHIDEATDDWPNPPHRSHLCGSCGCIWRPADVPTVGVERVETASKLDWSIINGKAIRPPSPPATAHASTSPGPVNCLLRAVAQKEEGLTAFSQRPNCERCRATSPEGCIFFELDGTAKNSATATIRPGPVELDPPA